MKKIFVLLMVFVLVTVLAACGKSPAGDQTMPVDTGVVQDAETGDTTTPEQPTPEGNTLPEGINPEDYSKFVQFELPEDFRQAAVDHMRKQSSIVWTPAQNFGYKHDFGDWKFELNYTRGQKYTGLPYASMMSTVEDFQRVLSENNNKYPCTADSFYNVMGVQCNTSVTHSLQQFTPIADGTSREFMPSFTDEFIGIICGNYKVPAGVERSVDIIQANSIDDMYRAYASAQKGDVILTKDEPKGVTHVRMVVDCVVVEKDGKINPNRSYLVCIEQTDTFDGSRKDGVNTTWWVDHQYTFTQLYTTNYIPISFEVYNTKKTVIPYLALDQINEENLSKGILSGAVTSDYPIKYCTVTLYDENGNLANRYIQQDPYDVYKINLRACSFSLFNEKVTPGKYTLIVEAGICPGKAELCRIQFDYTK